MRGGCLTRARGVSHQGKHYAERGRTTKLTGVVAKPDLSITEADRGYNARVECEVRRDV